MSYLIDKYKGIYRIKAPYDLHTNDYPRKLNGNYEDNDIYIDCQYGNKIFYYGNRGVLLAYIPSIGRGRNIIKAINEIDSNIVFDIEETDEEVLFKFNSKYDKKVIPLLKPKTSGAGISPFSSKNLPKTKYNIPDNDLNMYTQLIKNIPREEILNITHATNRFIKSLVTKRNTIDNIKSDMKLKGLKGKEYIHSIGKWNDYIKFLKREVISEENK